MAKIILIKGIGEDSAQKLRKAGITTTEALLRRGVTQDEVKQIAAQTGISDDLVQKWVDQAGLFRIRGIAGQYAGLLDSAGVDTVDELARRTAQNLTQKMRLVNTNKKLVRRLPAQSQVTYWITQAQGSLFSEAGYEEEYRVSEIENGSLTGVTLDSLPGDGGTDNKP